MDAVMDAVMTQAIATARATKPFLIVTHQFATFQFLMTAASFLYFLVFDFPGLGYS